MEYLSKSEVFKSLDQLYEACFNLTPIGSQTRLSPALGIGRILKDYPWTWKVMGTYGIQYVVPTDDISYKDALVAAQLGFSIENQDMVITNSPQGLGRAVLNGLTTFGQQGEKYTDDQVTQVMRELRKVDPQTGWNFRDYLLEAAIQVAMTLKGLGVKRIVGTSAERHPKVTDAQTLTLERAKRSMDLLYEKHGFEKVPPSFNYFREVV